MDKIKILKSLPMDMREKTTDAVYHTRTKSMSINLNACKNDAEKLQMGFYEYVARCINHEFIHYLLDIEQDYDTCHKLDKLCSMKRDMCIKYWLW